MTTHLLLAKGGEGEIASLDGERVTVLATTAAPPGAYVDATLNDGTPLRIKVRGCRRDGERFRIDGRIVDLSRATRERLAALVGKP